MGTQGGSGRRRAVQEGEVLFMPLEMMHISLALKDSASFRQALLLDAGGMVASRKGTN